MARERLLVLAALAVLVLAVLAAAVVGGEGDEVALESDRTTTTGDETTTTGEVLERSTTSRPTTTTATTEPSTTATTAAGATTTTAGAATTATTRRTPTTSSGPAPTAAPQPTTAPTPPPTTVPTSADLEVFLTRVADGRLRVRIANNGPHESGPIVVNLSNPGGGATFSNPTSASATCDTNGAHVQCAQSSTGRGGRILELFVTMATGDCNAAEFVAEVHSDTVADPNPGNNTTNPPLRISC